MYFITTAMGMTYNTKTYKFKIDHHKFTKYCCFV